jgi:hypothetical protein
MLYEYHVIYSVRYYPRFHVTAVGFGTYYPWIRGHYCGEILIQIHPTIKSRLILITLQIRNI